MRLATYNVEWMDALFDDAGNTLRDAEPAGRYEATRGEQLAALDCVFQAMDADAVLVVEAPNTGRKRRTEPALERFAAEAGLRARKAILGFANPTHQEIALLYDPEVIDVAHQPQGPETGPEGAEGAPRFDGYLQVDLDIDGTADLVEFSKPPLELLVRPKDDRPFRLIGVHVKSKAAHGARTAEEAATLAIRNRRKQLAQCIWLRRRVDAHLDRGERVILLGDLNDGPGLDSFEALFGRSGLEVVMGRDLPPDRRLHDPNARRALAGPLPALIATARFYNTDAESYLSALLDYILVSPDIAAEGPTWRIWHPFNDPEIYADPHLRHALLAASDHFPVTIDLTV